ncbi:hypothetical protein BT67DRAFT_65677 [Trichocladium antarcticum]|uniref:Uncharacterized protein n=1 Tax=Trichocladium antarcticum TaxID=1450529 RepID=A0AAN6UJQ8_9PEZI|nr:hypothetical protein BT67DRAFT_65677 [Trichocladium antarcticum]
MGRVHERREPCVLMGRRRRWATHDMNADERGHELESCIEGKPHGRICGKPSICLQHGLRGCCMWCCGLAGLSHLHTAWRLCVWCSRVWFLDWAGSALLWRVRRTCLQVNSD